MARILVIDDQKDVCATLALALERDGHSVTTASDGNEGLALFDPETTDLVITDILMPDKEGIETIMEMVKIRSDVRIIAMSGGSQVENVNFLDIARSFGASAMLKKPFTLDELSRTVEGCLAGQAD